MEEGGDVMIDVCVGRKVDVLSCGGFDGVVDGKSKFE